MRQIAMAVLIGLAVIFPAAAQEVVVALTDSTPNFSMRQPDGSTTGINVELAALLCSRIGLHCRYQPMPLAALVAQIRDGHAQIGFGNLIKTPERAQTMLFSQPYWRSTSVFIGRRDLAGTSMTKLVQGRKVAVQEGSRQAKWLHDNFGADFTPVTKPTISEVIAALKNNHADLALAPMMTVQPFLITPSGAEFGFVSDPIDAGWPVHIVIAKNRPDLQAKIDEALEEVTRDGSLGRIVRAYVPFDIF
ncbi:substrate-binding periplasmic protein [Magnetospirillum sulfuroxidans]|uniref:Amino acid ABC transporter substrate-binding protein n=1 Tax=Magnetospirillum sulfuroxidans TaxID=611300 RepID=A0ABS5IAW6_9PROT|nr:ABC transporter substrate-binding protein [Magnetospirillum sulfuroxidans]MBR9971572.1 amino acid ABC transporter substrate-binding protein [Magnetospirillum sulfuroxidans]